MLAWKDGQPYSDRYGDVYFSSDSGLEESRHVFLQGNHLADRFAALREGENFSIGETGFGTGLNFLCAWQLFEQVASAGSSLDFFSVEKFPLEENELCKALSLWPELKVPAQSLLARWRRRVPGWNRWSFANGRVRLTLVLEDVALTLPQMQPKSIDAWFLDGFSPAKNSEMWNETVASGVARASRDSATLATYTSAGWVRRNLQQAGFVIERAQGFGRKREMMRGSLPGSKPVINVPTSVLVIGAGLAGCTTAHALAQRGISVILIDRAPHLASAASGNPRGVLHARIGASMSPLHCFVLSAYGHALALFDEVVPVDGVTRTECGLLQLATPPSEAKRITKLSELEWPAHLLQFVDADQASQFAGVSMTHGGMWFPAGGWVVPPLVCARLAEHPLIVHRFDCEVTSLTHTSSGWSASGADFAMEAEQVVVCCGHQARALKQFAAFPLQSVRGQISELPATFGSEKLRTVVCAEGYCTPAVEGLHVAGATTTFNDETMDVREAEHMQNLAQLAEHMPALNKAFGIVEASQMSGRAGIRCSAPGTMPLVGEIEPGLFCSLAHGTRGLLTAGLAGEVLAAQISGQLPPLPTSILAALYPLPRTRHQG